MDSILADIENALGTVQRTLDALTSRGDNELAFDIAKAQYRASIRSSWPANLGSLVQALEAAEQNKECKLDLEEREQLRKAIAVLRRVISQ